MDLCAGCPGTSPGGQRRKAPKTLSLLALCRPLTQGWGWLIGRRADVCRVPLWCPWENSATEAAELLGQKTTSDLGFCEWS